MSGSSYYPARSRVSRRRFACNLVNAFSLFPKRNLLTIQPVDLLKTRMQQGDGKISVQRNTLILGTARNVILENGLKGLWRGTNASLIRNIPGVALYMTSVTQMRSFMSASPYFAAVRVHTRDAKTSSVLPTLTSTGNLLAGATTRVGVGFLLNPFSVLKAQFESNMYAYQSLSGALISITRQGPSELLRGFLASSLRDAPYAGLFIVFYEGIKRETYSLFPTTSSAHAAAIHSISAASAGAIATLATHPFDVIKTKIQVRSEERYHGLWRTIRTIWQQRGTSGYFDGASLRLSRKVLSSAIGWAVYEGYLMFVRT